MKTIVFFVVFVSGIHGWAYPFHESLLRKKTEKFCSCHQGVKNFFFLEAAMMARVQCADGTKTNMTFGKKISKTCNLK